MTDDSQTPRITPELCAATKQRLVFRPKTIPEAAFIAEQFMAMGYKYYKPEYAQQLETALKGAVYLDTDKTIMVTADVPSGTNIDCSIDGFKQFFIPEAPLSEDARIKPADCLNRALAFYPRTNAEARGILGFLLKAGASCRDEEYNPAMMMTHAIVHGIIVRDGRISFGPSPQELIGAEICSVLDLGLRPGVALSPEQATVMAAFNEMGARLEQMSQRIARLEEAVLPHDIPKPFVLKLKPKP